MAAVAAAQWLAPPDGVGVQDFGATGWVQMQMQMQMQTQRQLQRQTQTQLALSMPRWSPQPLSRCSAGVQTFRPQQA